MREGKGPKAKAKEKVEGDKARHGAKIQYDMIRYATSYTLRREMHRRNLPACRRQKGVTVDRIHRQPLPTGRREYHFSLVLLRDIPDPSLMLPLYSTPPTFDFYSRQPVIVLHPLPSNPLPLLYPSRSFLAGNSSSTTNSTIAHQRDAATDGATPTRTEKHKQGTGARKHRVSSRHNITDERPNRIARTSTNEHAFDSQLPPNLFGCREDRGSR